MRWKVTAVIVLMIALHQDFWFWGDATLVFGVLPVGLAWHAAYSVLASVVLAGLVRYAWPAHLEESEPEPAAKVPAPEVVS
jgi:uncharacterized oligopeptide transporter (OPT) family protein